MFCICDAELRTSDKECAICNTQRCPECQVGCQICNKAVCAAVCGFLCFKCSKHTCTKCEPHERCIECNLTTCSKCKSPDKKRCKECI